MERQNRTLRDGPWIHYPCIALAAWLLSSPDTMGYPSQALRLSDLASGTALLLLSVSALLIRAPWIKWVSGAVGLWLTAAPLVFWAPDAASAANGALIGSLVIVCAVIIPNASESGPARSETPPGWSYNPSTWEQRIPIIGLAFLGFLMARYLSAFQLGHIRAVWDPFFGSGTQAVLTSDVSKAFPVSDAGLGAWSYLLDALAGAIGGSRRWRSMPWVVALFGFMVIPPGVTSIALVILQPVGVGAWCTLCLATAVVMLLMVPPAIDEVVATAQALAQARKRGRSLWKCFWKGVPEELAPVTAAADPGEPAPSRAMRLPWHLALATALGIWCLAAPAVLGAQGLASDSSHFLGALIVTFSVIAFAQAARPLRYVNLPLGLLLAAGIWFLDGGSIAYRLSSTATGVLVAVLSLSLGPIQDRFASYDKWVRWSPLRRRPDPGKGSDEAAA